MGSSKRAKSGILLMLQIERMTQIRATRALRRMSSEVLSRYTNVCLFVSSKILSFRGEARNPLFLTTRSKAKPDPATIS